MSGNPFGVSAMSGAGFGTFAPEAPPDPSQPAWMTSFQQELKQIQEKGLRDWAKDLNDQKIAEMRKEILKKMGLSEDDLNKMSPQAQASIENMIAEEIRQRLAAEAELNGKDKKDGPQGIDGTTSKSPDDQADALAEMQSGANGMGPGMTLLRAMEQQQQQTATQAQKEQDH